MTDALRPQTIHPPFARYVHGVAVPAGHRLIATSGQLGIRADGTIPEGVEAQTELCFVAIDAILAEGGMGREDVVRVNAFVTGREHLPGYMAARDTWLEKVDPPPASTLMIVSGFARSEFVVEVEVLAAAP
ncbi:RidA family protein [Pontivivens ytuae]|uniref:RidA family protein n=1 Tax=Pontivivens ytuae TaxID=2789856 RepID=A0A7S9LVS8_9RHOB|nr:RidA family protein [Pontivivens ytuae]QPH55900.1 RidA family protein [Pontivivens ytuae]